MRKALNVCGLTLLFLLIMDAGVGAALSYAERIGRFNSIVQYFEYGRSVPGKLNKWKASPGVPGNLFDVAWRPDTLAISHAHFVADAADGAPVVRSYGMSFVDNILRAAVGMRPDLKWDSHGGPGAPPNYTYSVFEDDRANRRAGDIVVLGILSSAVPAMTALSNRTWIFEQPAPFTYPIYRPDGDGLARTEPLVTSAAMERSLTEDAALRRAWRDQLAREDSFYSARAFGAVWLDRSPFMRLVRRSLAISSINRRKARIVSDSSHPLRETLNRMIVAFAETARADGQTPVVFLIQTRDPGDIDLASAFGATLAENGIAYLATAEIVDISDPANFAGDGHYRPMADRAFAERFLELVVADASPGPKGN